jgi:type I restriction enzyme M protein
LVPLSEIEDNNFDLNIGRYLKADAAEVVDVSEALSEFNKAREDLATLEKELIAKLKAAGYA